MGRWFSIWTGRNFGFPCKNNLGRIYCMCTQIPNKHEPWDTQLMQWTNEAGKSVDPFMRWDHVATLGEWWERAFAQLTRPDLFCFCIFLVVALATGWWLAPPTLAPKKVRTCFLNENKGIGKQQRRFCSSKAFALIYRISLMLSMALQSLHRHSQCHALIGTIPVRV